MILALKTDSSEVYLALYDDTGALKAEETWDAGRELAKYLLGHIDALLKQAGSDWKSVSGIAVFKGPGSFTGLRIGITVANTLAYANGVAIVGTSGENWLSEGLSRLNAGQNDRIVLPEYGAEAHITTPKK